MKTTITVTACGEPGSFTRRVQDDPTIATALLDASREALRHLAEGAPNGRADLSGDAAGVYDALAAAIAAAEGGTDEDR